MAEFGPEETSISPTPNYVEPGQGVTKASASGLIAGLSGAAVDFFEERKASRNERAVSDFMASQVRVVDALEQGTGGIKSSSQARSILRKNFIDAYTANPALMGDLVKAQQSIIGLFGDSSIISQGTVEEQRINDRRDQLVSAGLVAPNATEAEFQSAETSARIAAAARERFDERKRTLDLQLAQENVTETQRKRLLAEKEQETLTYINSTSDVELRSLDNQFKQILGSNLSETEKQQQIEDVFIEWRAQANALVGGLENGQFSAFLVPFEDLKDVSISRATGELSDAERARNITRIMEVNRHLALQDPNIARLATASGLFSDTVFQQALIGNDEAFEAAMKFLAGTDPNGNGSANPYTTNPNEGKGMKEVLGSVLRGISSPDEAVANEASARIGTLMASMEDYEGLIRRDPEAAIEIVNWLGSVEFQKAMSSNPEVFGDMEGAAQVLNTHYNNEVWNMVANEFRNNSVEVVGGETTEIPRMTGPGMGFLNDPGTDTRRTVSDQAAPSLVGARSTPTGMEFFPLLTGEQDGGVEAAALSRKLNKELAPVINTTVRAASHMEGNTNYQQMWEKVGDQILGGGMTNDEGDDLTLGAFEGGDTGPIAGSVVEAGAGYTVVTNDEGQTVRREGTRAWRNNNPGNIEAGRFADSMGAIGSDGRFAVFPTYEAGREAKKALLFESSSYRDRTITSAINRYAPPSENNTNRYIRAVADAIGVSPGTRLSSLSDAQRETMLDAMERVEGFKEGREVVVGGTDFASEADAQAAFQRGEIKIGDTITINGEEMEVGE